MEALEQEKDNLAWGLEMSHTWENNTLDEISFMLSWVEQAEAKALQTETRAKLAEERVVKVETELENSLEQVTDLNLHSTA